MNPEQNSSSTQNHETPPSQTNNQNMMAIFSYLFLLVIIPLLTDAKNDPFVKFHAKQGLVLLVVWVVSSMIMVIPILGWIVGFVLYILAVVCTVLGIVNVIQGKEKELPLIGKYASKFNI